LERATAPTEASTEANASRRSFGPFCAIDGRLRFLDLARGLAIIFMVLQHVQIVFAVDSGEASVLGQVFLLLGTAPAAPVFMVVMGFLYGSSAGDDLRSGVVRGLKLFAFGYALNLLRFVIPGLLAGGSPAVQAFLGPDWWGPFFEIDILQLAGLSLVLLALVKRYVRDPRAVLALAAGVATLSSFLWGIGGSVVLDPLWGVGDWVSFPLFPWVAYPLLGLSLAGFTIRATSDGRLIRFWTYAGAAALLVGAALVVLAPAETGILAFGDYYRSGLPVQLMLAGFVLLWLSLMWWLDERLSWRVIPLYLTSLSRNITAIYVIQWVLIGWLAIVFVVMNQPSWAAALAAPPILVASHLLSLGYERARRSRRARRLAEAGKNGGNTQTDAADRSSS
jgi:surface polysaccharide O-acyltransferase-like enzyme